MGRVGKCISAQASHRTVPDSLPSYGSCQSKSCSLPVSGQRVGERFAAPASTAQGLCRCCLLCTCAATTSISGSSAYSIPAIGRCCHIRHNILSIPVPWHLSTPLSVRNANSVRLYNFSCKSAKLLQHFRKVIHDFNSSMVRLKVTIVYLNNMKEIYFNSSMVRLKVSLTPYRSTEKKISIPLWCD